MRTTGRRRLAHAMATVASVLVASTAIAQATDPGGPVQQRVLDPTGQEITEANPAPVPVIEGVSCTPSCDLYAKEGTITVGGHSVPIWGYATEADGPAQVPGPTIVATEGDAISITLHNDLADAGTATSLSFPRVPTGDVTVASVPAGGLGVGDSGSYSFVASTVGTSIYEAGPTATGNRQIAMGLAGALVVRPLACPTDPVTRCLYGADELGVTAATNDATDEVLVALNDLDPAFAADPLTYEMSAYAPSLHLINGRAFPDTDVIDTQPGHTLALRYANLSPIAHTMGVLGLHQDLVGRDASVLPHGQQVVAPLLTSGQTADASVHLPVDALAGQRYALFDQGRTLDNAGDPGFGGALAFVNVWREHVDRNGQPIATLHPLAAETTPGDPLPFSGSVPTGTTGVRWYVDKLPVPAPDGTALEAGATTFSDTVSAASLVPLANGSHVIWVQLTSSPLPPITDPPTAWAPTWGQQVGVAFTLDRRGPVMSGTSMDPAATNGDIDPTLRTTANTKVTGTADVVEGRYAVDSDCVSAQDGALMGPDPGAPDDPLPGQPTQGLQASVPTGSMAEGIHTAYVTAKDDLGHWPTSNPVLLPAPDPQTEPPTPPAYETTPMCDSVAFAVDRTAPSVSNGVVEPSPTNGSQGAAGNTNFLDSVRLKVTVTDPVHGDAGFDPVSSPIATAEAFLEEAHVDGAGNPIALPSGAVTGDGIELLPLDGAFDTDVEQAYVYIPLATVRSLTPGVHSIWVHARDDAGNWGPIGESPDATLDYEPDAPSISYLTVTGSTLSAGATAARSDLTITSMEYSIGQSPGTWTALPITAAGPVATVDSTPIAAHAADQNVFVRATDELGHTSGPVGLPVIDSVVRTTGNGLGAIALSGTGDLQQVQYKVAAFGALPSSTGWTSIAGATGPSPLTAVLPTSLQQVALGQTVWLRATDVQGNTGPVFALPVATSATRGSGTVSGTAEARGGAVQMVQTVRTGSSSNTAPAGGWSDVPGFAAGPSPQSFSRSGIANGGRVWVRVQDGAGSWGPAVRAA